MTGSVGGRASEIALGEKMENSDEICLSKAIPPIYSGQSQDIVHIYNCVHNCYGHHQNASSTDRLVNNQLLSKGTPIHHNSVQPPTTVPSCSNLTPNAHPAVRTTCEEARGFRKGVSNGAVEGGLGAVLNTFREVHGGERRYSYLSKRRGGVVGEELRSGGFGVGGSRVIGRDGELGRPDGEGE